MSSKPTKSGLTSTAFEPPLTYPMYMTSNDDLHAAAACASAQAHVLFGRTKSDDVQSADEGGMGLSYAERFKRWSFEQERGAPTRDLQSYSVCAPLLAVSNDHHFLSAAAAAGEAGRVNTAAEDMRESAFPARLANLLGSSNGGSLNVGFSPLPSSNTPFAEEGYRTLTSKQQYSTAQADMEILRANEGHNAVSGSVHLFEDIPSSLTGHNAELATDSDYHLPYCNHTHRPSPFASSFSTLHQTSSQHSELFSDHHSRWGPTLHASGATTNHHAELLLLPGISESAVEATPPNPPLSAINKLDHLQVSSLHDKQSSTIALPLGGTGETGRPPPPAVQLWNADGVDMAVGLGIHESSLRKSSNLALSNADQHFSAQCHAHPGLSLLLQPPLQRASSFLALDAARYNARPASVCAVVAGSLGILRSSKYLKPAQQLLNECCNVCRENHERTERSSDIAKSSSISTSFNNMQGSGLGGGDACVAGADVHEDDERARRSFFSVSGAQKSSQCRDLDVKNDKSKVQLDRSSTGTDPQPSPKQLPADERCHLQMRKARLIAMVEELDRRYQQYRDQLQLIVTSYESAAGMGGAAPYTTLARRAMSKQFRGLRDAIGEHISAVCRMLGEEVSSVPILSRGETPKLRLVDQRLRHQRSLQQIGMLPQQQAWRPQRGLPERSVSVLRAWLFEHFLHPYPKDSEKAMLARLTGLSRNQVSNWFINARVRLWKPMIEEMYIEEGKTLHQQEQYQDQGAEMILSSHAEDMESAEQQDTANGSHSDGLQMVSASNMSSMQWIMAGEKQQEPATPSHGCMMPLRGQGLDQQVQHLLGGWHPTHYSDSGSSTAHNDLQSLIQFHSSARKHATTGDGLPSADGQSQPFSWMMKLPAPAAAAHLGEILTAGNTQLYNHSPHQLSSESQASAVIQQLHQQQAPQFSSSRSNQYKNGVSLTLGLQQPPLHYNRNSNSTANPYQVRPSEALLF